MMNEYTGRKSDLILDKLNRIHDAKLSGVMEGHELSKLIIDIGDLYAKGKHTEEEIESFESLIPKSNVFSRDHYDLEVAYNTVKQNNTASLMSRESKFEFTKRI